MAGILDFLDQQQSPYSGLLNLPPSAGFPAPPVDQADEAQKALDARKAAGLAARRAFAQQDVRRDDLATVDASNPGIAYALNPIGGDLGPYSGKQFVPSAFGALAPVEAATPPMTGPIPLPRPRPAAAAPQLIAPPSVDDTTLPPNATPTSGQVAPPAVPETSLMGRIGQGLKDAGERIGDHTGMLLAMAGGLAGAPSWGTGLSRAFQGAAAALPLDQKLVNQNQTVQALMQRGLPADMAKAAAGNPAILQQILPQVFGAKQRKFTQIGEDMMGNKQFGFVDEASGKAYDMAGKEIAPGQAGSGNVMIPTGPDGQPLQGPALLTHLESTNPQAAAEIKAMIAGDAANTRNVQKLAPLAHLVDPTFSEATYPTRLALKKDYFGGGKAFEETQALNTVSGHLGRLADSADALGNTGFKPWNWLKNATADTLTGSPALVKFRNDLVTTQNELAKAYHGGHVSDSAYAAFNKSINEAQTPEEMKAAIGELAGLLESKIKARESGYRAGMGGAPLPDQYSALNDEAKHSFARINNWATGTAQPQTTGAQAALPRVNSPAEAAKLPKGTHFLDSNGVERIVP